ncbi:MAG TPA: sodium ion-translocating decarboxylase subunit beta [Thermotogota bacterium]|nr:sodium ion-translocating decarboxylase subunit beta [Thermotogota bacterium]HRW34604.1 sodium ion-translocating decarboxylase subunit beta [Thermotogota bacterium]
MLVQAYASFFTSSAFAGLTLGNLFMIGLGSVLLYVAVAKHAEPLLLIPIGFGMILANIPPLYTGLFLEPVGNSAGGLMYYINLGLQYGIYPPLIFLGIGALTDFSFMLSNPITIFLGGAAQMGIFVAFFMARMLGFELLPSAAISIIGGADGPTSIYIANKFAPDMLAIIAIAAYSYIALIPIIQPPLMKLCTTKKERLIRMKPPRKVKKVEKLVFSVVTTVFIGLLVPQALPLVGMLMLGNFLKENGLTKRLAEACSKYIADPAIIMLCLSVGASAKADVFLSETSLLILFLGALAFVISTISGLLFAKLMNLFLKVKINPLIGGAGVSAVPDSARVAQMVAQKEDPTNFILMHAMGPNVAGVIGSAVAAGVFLSILGR